MTLRKDIRSYRAFIKKMRLVQSCHLLSKARFEISNLPDDFYKLLFIKTGEGFYKIGKKDFSVFPGSFIVAFTDKKIDLTSLHGMGWIISFKNIFTHDRYFKIESNLERLSISSAYGLTWIERLNLIEQECGSSQRYRQDYARVLIELILIDLHRILDNESSSSNPLIDRAIQFIEDNYTSPISLSDVAISVNRSPSYLASLFRKQTGITVVKWISKRRMIRAQSLLVNTNYTVNEIAEKVGYLDLRYFSRRFKEECGLPPVKWRQLKQNK